MQYSILIYGAEGGFDRLPEEEQNAVMQGHEDLQKILQRQGAFVTAKLMPTSNAITIKPAAKSGSKPLIVDGPYAETKESFLGFYVVDCKDLDAALDLARHISSSYVTLEIRPVSWMDGVLDSENADR